MEAEGFSVDEGHDLADDAGVLQAFYAAPAGGLGHAGLAGDFCDRQRGVFLEDAQDSDVAYVEGGFFFGHRAHKNFLFVLGS